MDGLAERVVQQVTSRFGEGWTELGVTSNPDQEFICLPALYVKQIRKVITDMVPTIRLEEEEDAYGCNNDDCDGAILPLPPSFPLPP
jgi:hypothetical protein